MTPPPHIELRYRNHRGEIVVREIVPGRVYYDLHGDEFHPNPGWRLQCWDIEKQGIRIYDLAECNFVMGRWT